MAETISNEQPMVALSAQAGDIMALLASLAILIAFSVGLYT